jgi:hypothetical protein
LQLPLITAVYAGSPELPAAVEASIRAQQNNDASVSMGLAAARILEKVRAQATLSRGELYCVQTRMRAISWQPQGLWQTW